MSYLATKPMDATRAALEYPTLTTVTLMTGGTPSPLTGSLPALPTVASGATSAYPCGH